MKASAPASSANLGPGFDALALALDIRCEVTVEASDAWEFPETDRNGFLGRAAARVSDRPLRVEVASDIPVGRGLGSSAALLAALTLAVTRLRGEDDDLPAIYRVVSELEEHADNAAAAVFGGCVYAASDRVHQLEVHSSWSVVVAVPDDTLSTPAARRALPDSVPFGVAVRTSSRAIRLVEALRLGDVDLMAGIGADELHEPTRAALRPVTGELLAAGRTAGAPFVAVSGSGPSVVAVVTADTIGPVQSALAEVVGSGLILSPGVAEEGVR